MFMNSSEYRLFSCCLLAKKLQLESCRGNLDNVKILVKEIGVHANDNIALKCASRYNRLEIVKFLVKNGADIHAQNDYALSTAIYHGYLEIVKFLVKNGANIHVNSDDGLRLASQIDNVELTKFLVMQGCSIYKLTTRTMPNLYFNAGFMSLLIDKGCDLNIIRNLSLIHI